MRVNKLLKISAMMAFLFTINQSGFAKTTAQEAYDKYKSSYEAYQSAIAENKSNAEIQSALKAYNEAKNEYTTKLGIISSDSLSLSETASTRTSSTPDKK